MLGVRDWHWYHMLALWCASALLMAALLVGRMLVGRPERVFMPYPTGARSLVAFIRAVWQWSPAVAVLLSLVVGVALVLSVYWIAARMRG